VESSGTKGIDSVRLLRRVEQAHVIRLSLEDQRAFVEAILNPPEPTTALRRAFPRHRELIKESR
jgi:uncharacterized protein (DUF1778 family)